ncbi:LuxR C-terminal-related transcriptional regulator [uncultured Erythrobacter sp.]|uniref:helix-turn-helix transcriptional regulator n=1 Tax=uncultured Erythrobacter sp. TaxID=263913 RepID=UPI0026361434|nr:LuxR C-terminal-related transcriptional regulator [uncultured Erythrobacter sp.]
MAGNTFKYALLYGLPLAGLVFVLQWIEYRYLVFSMPGEIYIGLVAVIFITLGIWMGMRLTAAPASSEFEPNEKAIQSLGLTKRECEILGHLAKGASNKEIARTLGVSPNTIKTHVASLFLKLEVSGRGKAVEAARGLSLIP